ncbi:hypothetical protein ELG66_00900 [Rhizobium leguminosarum]|uniref:hypothetical protein n=1 Tax=Rhizobium leguminosarum TaxID=384 RepID=UPI001031DF6A|nr:hypothetical protein [Rhizobium leguminosarum]TBH34583.1 hypothetical protein ELG66_00900 [Rhizobium leguminosarum]
MSSNWKFWANEREWPEDAYGYVFLARALCTVGKALYPEWTGKEPLTPEPLLDLWLDAGGMKILQTPDMVSQSTLDEVRRLLYTHAPEKLEIQESWQNQLGPLRTARDAWKATTEHKRLKWTFTEQSWKDGVEVVRRENERRQAAIDRYTNARNFLRAAMRDGKLTFVLLPPEGGRFSEPMPASWWNVKEVAHRFYVCKMSPKVPFDTRSAWGAESQDIFVSGEQLGPLLNVGRPKNSDEANSRFEKVRVIYDEMERVGGHPPSVRALEEACKRQGIPSTVSREFHKQLGAQRLRN